jgi:hypothetical protein
MALPSQGGFSSVRQGGSYRRRRRSHGTSWIVLLAIGGLTTWYFWPEGDLATDSGTGISMSGDTNTIATPPKVAEDSTELEPTGIVETPIVQERTMVAVVEPEEIELEPELPMTPIPLIATTSVNLDESLALLDRGQIVEARHQLSESLRSGTLTESEIAQARGVLTDLSDRLLFSPFITDGDPYAIEYIIRNGDTLSGIVQKMGLQVDWRFIQRVNQIGLTSSIRPGQNLKLITGPFHAIVDKKAFRIDLFLGDGDAQVFVCSYRVGLGEFNSTPVGLFKVRRNSKLLNPMWVNPRTAEIFSSDNPLNPIGERWIGLQGMDERTKDLSGLGIHGTIEPQSIGTNASMGCVRMLEGDVEEVYEMLLEGVSTVEIH